MIYISTSLKYVVKRFMFDIFADDVTTDTIIDDSALRFNHIYENNELHGTISNNVGKRWWRKHPGPRRPKNALMQLHELKPGLEFQLLRQTGPVHAVTFYMAAKVRYV